MVRISFALIDKSEVAKFKKQNIIIEETGEKLTIEVSKEYTMQVIETIRHAYILGNGCFELHFY